MLILPTIASQQFRATQARPWDIMFLVSEVAAGAMQGHFAAELYADTRKRRALVLQCAKAILTSRWGWLWRSSEALQFIVIRSDQGTIGAALASTVRDADGLQIMTIEYVVVDSGFRRLGVGEALVRDLLEKATQGDQKVVCYCTPKSQGMQRLLRQLGFVRTQKVHALNVGDSKLLLPARWSWRP
ncbi:GNAT family N-acetyltransferase [Dyella subtropica]|uniref:GNAT family N-acetyltransferase n=1 Tax=Dyella subtropica TaxID=2992127 RepID=UPI0022539EC3|nr:GNAT family N-acetyltransferase [Dyella subtropica]